MNNRMKGLILGVATGLLIGSAGTPVQAGNLDVNINIGAPPAVVVGPPTMLFLAEPGVYVAVGTPYDIFFFTGRYYYFYSGNWFRGPGFDGPWTHVQFRALPPGLRQYKIQQLQMFREREFKVYKDQGPRYNGRKFVGGGGPATPGNGPMKGPQMKEGMGRGRGPKN